MVSAATAERSEMRTTLWLPASADSAHEYTKMVSTLAGGRWKTLPRGKTNASGSSRIEHMNLPAAFSAGRPQEVVTSTPGKRSPIAITFFPLRFTTIPCFH